jgi:putative transposase
MARLVVPGFPHHVTQRGVRKQRTFFGDNDYKAYIALLRDARVKAGVEIWAYCLMPNHVHIVAVPDCEDGLSSLFRRVHGDYARMVNSRNKWSGHLWQQRFYSAVMDDAHAIAALRYVELNPVRAGLCDRPDAWQWSSVHTHLGSIDDGVVNNDATQNIVGNWREFLNVDSAHGDIDSIRNFTKTGRPAGDNDFVDMLETLTGKAIHARRPGPTKR